LAHFIARSSDTSTWASIGLLLLRLAASRQLLRAANEDARINAQGPAYHDCADADAGVTRSKASTIFNAIASG
jgi:hypothetical protein